MEIAAEASRLDVRKHSWQQGYLLLELRETEEFPTLDHQMQSTAHLDRQPAGNTVRAGSSGGPS